MPGVEPDHVKYVLDQEAVDPPVLVHAEGELPGIVVELLPASDAESVLRDSLLAEVDGMETCGGIRLGVCKRANLSRDMSLIRPSNA
jgi:hypothetical protein